MGFWDKFADIWKDPLSTKAYDDTYHGVINSVKDAGKSLWSGLWNTIGSAFNEQDGSDQLHTGLKEFSRFGGDLLSTGGNLASFASSIPIVNQAFSSYNYLQNEVVKRPIGTAGLVLGDDLKGVDRPWTHENTFTGEVKGLLDTWRQAYNQTENVSAGQAWLYAGGQSPVPVGGALTQGMFGRGVPDPRTPDGQAYFHKSWSEQQLGSGLIDAGITLFADPTLVVGKVGKAAKLKYLSKPLTAASVGDKAADLKYISSVNNDHLFNFYRNEAPNEDVALQTVMHKVPYGGQRNGVLWDAAHMEDEQKSRDVFNDALLAQRGDPAAQERLVAAVPDMARSIVNRQIAVRRADLVRRLGDSPETDDAVEKSVDALRETDFQAMATAASQGRGIYGEAFGKAIGQNQPRLSLTSKWRVGMHQIFNGDPAYLFAPADSIGRAGSRAAGALRKFTPSATTTKIIDHNDENIAHLMRANWESARVLPAQRVNDLTAMYARATTAGSRSAIWHQAEDEITAAMAAKHGYAPGEVQQVLPMVRRLRSAAQSSFTNARRYMSTDIKKVASDLLDQGDEIAANRASQLADGVDAAVARGDQPRSWIAAVDIDGNTIVYPDGWDPAEKPLMDSQNIRMAPQMDWRVLDHAMRWNRKGPVGATAYKVYDGTVALADAVNSAWKIGTLARLGLMWRGPSDEIARSVAMYGSGPVLANSASGVVNAARTKLAGGVDKLGTRLQADKVRIDRTRRGLDTHDPVDAVADEEQAASQPLADQVGGEPRYRTIEAQLADGIIPVQTYLDHINHMADNQPGELHPDLAMMVQARRDGMSAGDFARHAVEHALAMHGRDSYVSPDWRQAFLDHAESAHASRAVGEDAKPVVIDPHSGLSPDAQDTASYTLRNRFALPPGDENEALRQWVVNNQDELLKPNTVMHGVISRSGRVAVSLATPFDALTPLKPTGGVRLGKLGKLADWLRPGAQGLAVDLGNGRTMRLDSWSEGGLGQQFEGQVASGRGNGKGWADRVQDQTYAELMHATKNSWQDTLPTQPGYAPSWERAVNVQLGNDAVARQFMQGRSVDDVLQWLYGTKNGRAYYEKMGAWQARAVDQVNTVKAMVDMYLPDDGSGAAKVMRRRALAQNATHDGDLANVVPDTDQRPTVHGGALDLAVGQSYKAKFDKAVNGMFRVFQDMPADYFSRFPMAKAAYEQHATQIAQVMQKQFDKAGHEFIPADWATKIEGMARGRALADVRKYLYDATTTHDLAKIGRVVVPFASAAMDSYLKWGTIFKEKPWTAYQLWKVWTAPDNAGLIQDENGYHLKKENGRQVWVSINPDTLKQTVVPTSQVGRDRMVTFRLPSFMQPHQMPGAQATMSFNKEQLNTMLTMPTSGPMVAVPLSNFAMTHPEFADNKFVKTFILPYGPQADWKQLVIPGSLRTAYQFFKGDEGDAAQYQATAIMQTELARYAQGLRSTSPTYAEVREKANQLRGIRFLYQFSGITPQFNTPYALYVDQWRQMLANEGARKKVDPNYSAATDFYNQHGDELYALTMAVSRNRAGVPATIGGQRAYEKYQSLIDGNPDIANWIIGKEGAGAFSQAVYQHQLEQAAAPGSTDKMRYRMGLKESTEENARALGWQRWNKLQDAIDLDLERRGLDNVNQPGAEDLKAIRDQFINKNMYWNVQPDAAPSELSPWYKEFSDRNASKMTDRLTQFANVVRDPRLSQRDDVQGVAQYLVARQQMAGIMADNGLKTLNSKKAAPFLSMWQQYVQSLKRNNLSFATTYNRYLIGDQYLDAPFQLKTSK